MKRLTVFLSLLSLVIGPIARVENVRTVTVEKDGARGVFTIERAAEERYLRVFGYNMDIFKHAPGSPMMLFPFALIFSSMKEANDIWNSYMCEEKAMAISRFELVLPENPGVQKALEDANAEFVNDHKTGEASRHCLRVKVARVTIKEFYPAGESTNKVDSYRIGAMAQFPTSYPTVMYISETESVDCDMTFPTESEEEPSPKVGSSMVE